MSKFESDYRRILRQVLEEGTPVKNRTGVNAITSFNKQINIDLEKGFPIVTGKKIFFDKAYHEFIWMQQGMTTTTYLNQNGIYWWDGYAHNGNLGKTYGYQLRNYNGKEDQLMDAVREINAGSRRAYITMWNPSDIEEQPIPCCYTSFNFVRIGDELNMSMEFRSSDLFLGLPYDICVGALLLTWVARFCELKPKMLGINLTNAHIYMNHVQQVRQYLNLPIYKLPKLWIDDKLRDYKSGHYIESILNK